MTQRTEMGWVLKDTRKHLITQAQTTESMEISERQVVRGLRRWRREATNR